MEIISCVFITFIWIPIFLIIRIFYDFFSNVKILRKDVPMSEALCHAEKIAFIICVIAIAINTVFYFIGKVQEPDKAFFGISLIPFVWYLFSWNDRHNHLRWKTKVGERTIDYNMPKKYVIKALKIKILYLNSEEENLLKQLIYKDIVVYKPDEFEDTYSDKSFLYRNAVRLSATSLANLEHVKYDKYILKIDKQILPYTSSLF